MLQPAYFHSGDFSLHIDANFFSTFIPDFTGGGYESVARLSDSLRPIRYQELMEKPTEQRILHSIIRHEHRHFVDHILTNYGARRVYRNMATLVGLGPLFNLARKYGRLIAPLDAYCDELLMLHHYGIEKGDFEFLEHFGKLSLNDRLYYENDKKFGKEISKELPLDGVAFLEALAEGFECTQLSTSSGYSPLVDKGLPSGFKQKRFLSAVIECFASKGIRIDHERDRSDNAVVAVDTSLLYPVLVASLMVRNSTSMQPTSQERDAIWDAYRLSRYPSTRFRAIIEFLSQLGQERIKSASEPARLVDHICGALFVGNSVEDELRADAALGQKLYDTSIETLAEVSPETASYFSDFIKFRGLTAELFSEIPSIFLDNADYENHILRTARPRLLIQDQSGGTLQMMMGASQYNDGSWKDEFLNESELRPIAHRARDMGIATHVGIICAEPASDELQPEYFSQKFSISGLEAMRQLAPQLDLLANGKSLSLERELAIEEVIKSIESSGISVEVEPAFLRPSFDRRPAAILELLCKHFVMCAISGERLEPGNCILVSGYELKKHAGVLEKLAEPHMFAHFTSETFGFTPVHERYEYIFEDSKDHKSGKKIAFGE